MADADGYLSDKTNAGPDGWVANLGQDESPGMVPDGGDVNVHGNTWRDDNPGQKKGRGGPNDGYTGAIPAPNTSQASNVYATGWHQDNPGNSYPDGGSDGMGQELRGYVLNEPAPGTGLDREGPKHGSLYVPPIRYPNTETEFPLEDTSKGRGTGPTHRTQVDPRYQSGQSTARNPRNSD